jgi:hypothetical protein
VTNTGRLTWDSHGDSPFFLTYHWLEADADRYVTFEGLRTAFASPVEPGATVKLNAQVCALRQPGRYRLMWDVVQGRRFWLSTEPGAAATVTSTVLEGPIVAEPLQTIRPPVRPVRPGRLVLWRTAARMLRAHPIIGVGPDNFRLAYSPYAGLAAGDPRVHSNSMYIETLAGGGLLAGLAFTWLLWTAARMCAAGMTIAPAGPIAVGIAAAGVSILLHGLFDSFLSFTPVYVLFSVILGLAAACARGVEAGADAHRA